jgi:restriction system protein
MAVWLVRAGSHGEFEQKFLQENRIYLTWDYLNYPLDKLDSRNTLINILSQFDLDAKERKLVNHASQIWPFAFDMQLGDRVSSPSKNDYSRKT